jgi:GNAT superfamily N-acetyltransferase
MKYIVYNKISEFAKDLVWNGLKIHNDQFAVRNQMDFTVCAIEDETIIGVGMGESKYDWLILRYLWVEEKRQKNGIGTNILKEIEKLASERNLLGIHLDTFEFQAKEFYVKNGFSIFGEINNHPIGYKRYFMKKQIKINE